MAKTKKHSDNNINKTAVIPLIFGSVAGSVLYFSLMALFAAIALKQDLADEYYWILTLAAGCVSGFLSGYIAVIPTRKNGLISGILSVFPVIIIAFLAASIVTRTGIGFYGWVSVATMLLSGGISGIIAANKKKKTKLK